MIFDIKKLFTKSSTIGRFEYLKLTWGLLLFPMLIIQLAIMVPPNSLLYYIVATIAIITLLTYLTIFYIATYKRFNNIFDNTVTSIVSLIIFILVGVIRLFNIIFSILLILIPGKKKSDFIMSNKLFWVTFPLVILLFFSLRILGINRWIPGEAMTNTLQVKDRIIINIFDKEYHRGDIIIHSTEKKDVVFVKRIVALPGEKVEIKELQDGSYGIYINGKHLNEPYVKNVYDYPKLSSMSHAKMVVPEDSYYVVGDNRGNSFDSRYYGAIKRDKIKGKVSHIWYPISRRQVFTAPQYSFTETATPTVINDVTTYMDYMQKTMKAN